MFYVLNNEQLFSCMSLSIPGYGERPFSDTDTKGEARFP